MRKLKRIDRNVYFFNINKILYMNDVLLIHEDKEYLKYCLIEIDKILKSNNIDFKFKDYNIKEIKELRKLINNIVI